MPNAIKYSTTIPSGSLLKGTVALGVTTASIAGPTSTTGWYYGPNPPSSSLYQIFETAASGDPDVYCPQSNAELIQFVKTKGATGANTSSLSASLAWIGTQSNLIAANFEYPNIVTSGSLLNVDAGFVGSYPTTASNWYDISGNNSNGILTNGPTFDSANSGSIVFDGVDDYVQTPIQVLDRPCTFSTWFNFSSLTANGGFNTFFGQDTSVSISRGRFYFQKAGSSIEGMVRNKINFSIVKTDGSIVPTNGLNVVQTNTWYNYTAVLTATSISLYENGVLQNTTINSDSFITPNTNIVLNAGYFNNSIVDYWPGQSSIFQMYNRALTAAEVLQNYNALKGRFGL